MSNGLSMSRIVAQLAPSCMPAQTSAMDHGSAPAVEKTMNLPSGMRVTPAGNEMNVRTMGSRRPMNTVAAP